METELEMGNKSQKKLKGISEVAEALHSEVYGLVEKVSPVGRREVFVNGDLRGSGKIIYTPLQGLEHVFNIGVCPEVAGFDRDYKEYRHFKKVQKSRNVDEAKITPENYFKYVVAHEYGHLVATGGDVVNSVKVYEGFDERDISLVCESFAHWFGDSISGFDQFNLFTAISCSIDKEDLLYDVNPGLMFVLYNGFRKIGESKGVDYVIENKERISGEIVKEWDKKLAKGGTVEF